MTNVVVVGSQWGDEGKGKIVDWLSERADVVVRFQGGHNAGHTLVVDGGVYKLSLLPSGVVRPGKLSIIGNGVVVDPWALVDEIGRLSDLGLTITPDNLKIADNAPLILPLHGQVDRAREAASGNAKIGTTGRGIGPAYEDKVGRRAVRLCDLADREALAARVDALLLHHNALMRGLGEPEFERDELLRQAARDRAPGSALRGPGLAAPGRGAPRRPAHPLRGRAGRHARRRPRHLSLRHLLQHRRRPGGGRGRHGGRCDRLCPGHHQGLHDPRRQRSVSERADRRDRRDGWASGAASSAW